MIDRVAMCKRALGVPVAAAGGGAGGGHHAPHMVVPGMTDPSSTCLLCLVPACPFADEGIADMHRSVTTGSRCNRTPFGWAAVVLSPDATGTFVQRHYLPRVRDLDEAARMCYLFIVNRYVFLLGALVLDKAYALAVTSAEVTAVLPFDAKVVTVRGTSWIAMPLPEVALPKLKKKYRGRLEHLLSRNFTEGFFFSEDVDLLRSPFPYPIVNPLLSAERSSSPPPQVFPNEEDVADAAAFPTTRRSSRRESTTHPSATAAGGPSSGTHDEDHDENPFAHLLAANWSQHLHEPFAHLPPHVNPCVTLCRGFAVSGKVQCPLPEILRPHRPSVSDAGGLPTTAAAGVPPEVHILMIGRQDVRNPGPRYIGRGVNAEGHVGNDHLYELITWYYHTPSPASSTLLRPSVGGSSGCCESLGESPSPAASTIGDATMSSGGVTGGGSTPPNAPFIRFAKMTYLRGTVPLKFRSTLTRTGIGEATITIPPDTRQFSMAYLTRQTQLCSWCAVPSTPPPLPSQYSPVRRTDTSAVSSVISRAPRQPLPEGSGPPTASMFGSSVESPAPSARGFGADGPSMVSLAALPDESSPQPATADNSLRVVLPPAASAFVKPPVVWTPPQCPSKIRLLCLNLLRDVSTAGEDRLGREFQLAVNLWKQSTTAGPSSSASRRTHSAADTSSISSHGEKEVASANDGGGSGGNGGGGVSPGKPAAALLDGAPLVSPASELAAIPQQSPAAAIDVLHVDWLQLQKDVHLAGAVSVLWHTSLPCLDDANGGAFSVGECTLVQQGPHEFSLHVVANVHQTRFLRINCADSLDRTNVAAFYIAAQVLTAKMFPSLGLEVDHATCASMVANLTTSVPASFSSPASAAGYRDPMGAAATGPGEEAVPPSPRRGHSLSLPPDDTTTDLPDASAGVQAQQSLSKLRAAEEMPLAPCYCENLTRFKELTNPAVLRVLVELFIANGDAIAQNFTSTAALHTHVLRGLIPGMKSAPLNAVVSAQRRYENMFEDNKKFRVLETLLGKRRFFHFPSLMGTFGAMIVSYPRWGDAAVIRPLVVGAPGCVPRDQLVACVAEAVVLALAMDTPPLRLTVRDFVVRIGVPVDDCITVATDMKAAAKGTTSPGGGGDDDGPDDGPDDDVAFEIELDDGTGASAGTSVTTTGGSVAAIKAPQVVAGADGLPDGVCNLLAVIMARQPCHDHAIRALLRKASIRLPAPTAPGEVPAGAGAVHVSVIPYGYPVSSQSPQGPPGPTRGERVVTFFEGKAASLKQGLFSFLGKK